MVCKYILLLAIPFGMKTNSRVWISGGILAFPPLTIIIGLFFFSTSLSFVYRFDKI